jgi:replicative DNA helicase
MAKTADPSSREMPHSEESELALLGSILLRPTAIEKVYDIIRPGDFYRSAHRHVYEAMLERFNNRDAIDLITLQETLTTNEKLEQVGGVEFLSELSESVPTSYNIVSYAQIIADKAILRDLLETTWGIIEEGYSPGRAVREIVDDAERKIFEVGQREVESALKPIDEVVRESLKDIDKYFAEGEKFTGTATGFYELDDLTNGLQPGELSIIAARPSMGKTAFALNIAENVAIRDNLPVLIFTLEMSAKACGLRMLSSIAKIDMSRLRKGEADKDDYYDLTRAGSVLAESPLFIDDSGFVGTDDIRVKGRRLKAEKKKLGLILIDYIQLMRPRQGIQSREQQISDISRSLKGIAKELDVPVVALSQLNRGVENRDNKRPRLSDIRESGAVEQDADMIFFIYRDDYYNPETSESPGMAEIRLAKNRNGPTGNAELVFLKKNARFENKEQHRDDPY